MKKNLYKLILPFLLIILTSCEKEESIFDFSSEQNQVFKAFGWDFSNQGILKVEKVKNNISVIFGYGGNILVSIGEDGTLVIDNQFPQLQKNIMAEIKKLGGKNIDYVINTHWHFDHAEGNRAFGPKGSIIIAHENSKKFMKKNNTINIVYVEYPQQAYTGSSLPKITFKDRMELKFNNNNISLHNFGPGHTTGDTIVFFREANIIHFGDILNTDSMVFIDSGNGGSLAGMIKNLEGALKIINKDTIVIPGHGKITDYETVKKYLSALIITKDKLTEMIGNNMSLEEITKNNPVKDLESILGDTNVLIDRSYLSLIKERGNNEVIN